MMTSLFACVCVYVFFLFFVILSGWQGGTSSQEDVTELFTFLVCLLRCPALPLSEALFHGGKIEAGDSRISTERALFLSLPEEAKEPGTKMPVPIIHPFIVLVFGAVSLLAVVKKSPTIRPLLCLFWVFSFPLPCYTHPRRRKDEETLYQSLYTYNTSSFVVLVLSLALPCPTEEVKN